MKTINCYPLISFLPVTDDNMPGTQSEEKNSCCCELFNTILKALIDLLQSIECFCSENIYVFSDSESATC